jgi:hypothetical protein
VFKLKIKITYKSGIKINQELKLKIKITNKNDVFVFINMLAILFHNVLKKL